MVRLIVFALVCLVAVPVFAQTASPVTVESLVDFTSVFDGLKDMVKPVIVGAIGLGLAIWGCRWLFGVVKSMGRG